MMLRPKHFALVAALAIAACFITPTPSRAQTNAFEGTWHFAGGAAERRAIRRAIDGALANFNPVMREIVAAQLNETNRAYPRFELHLTPSSITVRLNGRSMTTPADGSARHITTQEGREADVSQRLQDGQLVQTMVNPQGTRTHTLSISQDGRLHVAVRIVSPHLPRPIQYALTYERR